MNDEAKKARSCFISEVIKLIDKHAKDDGNSQNILDLFMMDVLCLLDGCAEIKHPVFLAVGAYEGDICSGNLHWYFEQYRECLAPLVRRRLQDEFITGLH